MNNKITPVFPFKVHSKAEVALVEQAIELGATKTVKIGSVEFKLRPNRLGHLVYVKPNGTEIAISKMMADLKTIPDNIEVVMGDPLTASDYIYI